MRDDYDYDGNTLPLAYLLTFRTFGTWLHGDERYSVGRGGKNIYGTERIPPNEGLEKAMSDEINQSAVILNKMQRKAVEDEIRKTCIARGYILQAVNARTNHAMRLCRRI